jgi:hypothetical protein
VRSRRVRVAALVLALAGALPAVSASQIPFFGKKNDNNDLVFRSPDGKLSLAYPNKDWQILPGGGSVVATLAQKASEASVVVDYTKMNQALAPSEINDLFAELEAEDLATRQPEAKGFDPIAMNEHGVPTDVPGALHSRFIWAWDGELDSSHLFVKGQIKEYAELHDPESFSGVPEVFARSMDRYFRFASYLACDRLRDDSVAHRYLKPEKPASMEQTVNLPEPQPEVDVPVAQ